MNNERTGSNDPNETVNLFSELVQIIQMKTMTQSFCTEYERTVSVNHFVRFEQHCKMNDFR